MGRSGKGELRNRIFLTLTSLFSGPCSDSGTKIMTRDSAVPILEYRTIQEPGCDMRLAWVDVNRKKCTVLRRRHEALPILEYSVLRDGVRMRRMANSERALRIWCLFIGYQRARPLLRSASCNTNKTLAGLFGGSYLYLTKDSRSTNPWSAPHPTELFCGVCVANSSYLTRFTARTSQVRG